MFYPVKVRHFISWFSKKFNAEDHNTSLGAFHEKPTFKSIKVALRDDSWGAFHWPELAKQVHSGCNENLTLNPNCT